MRITFFILCCILAGPAFAQDEAVKNISWDKEKGTLNYTISGDSLLKIRAGSASGPVYRTLVDLEQRKAGVVQEPWDGKDESGLIDFQKYGALHFCIDAQPKPQKDLLLQVTLPKDVVLEAGLLRLESALTIGLDIDKEHKEWFLKKEVEIMAFLDNRLIKIERAKSLPYHLQLDCKILPHNAHLLTLNVWSSDHTSVAYKNFLIMREEKEGLAKPKAEKPKKLIGKIAYCQRQKGFWQVETANLDGKKSRQLTKSPEDKRYPAFSPDGKRIAYVTNTGQLWLMDEDGKNKQKISLPIHASQPRWSPDGKKVAFVSYQDLYHGDSEIWEVELESLKLKKLTNRPWLQYDPCYSPDEANIIFTDGPELYAQDIRKLDFKTNDVTQLTDNGAYPYDMQPAYSPDGEMIVYSSNQGGTYDIWMMDKFSQDRKNLALDPSHDIMPQFSKDGKKIFFLSDRSGNFGVWQMDIDGTNLRQVTRTKQDKQDLSIYTVLK